MKYERLTKREANGNYTYAKKITATYQVAMMEEAGRRDAEVFRRLAELEDKIERGELISTLQEDQSEQEIEFFAKHNAYIRRQAVIEFVDEFKSRYFFMMATYMKNPIYQCTEAELDRLVKEWRNRYETD